MAYSVPYRVTQIDLYLSKHTQPHQNGEDDFIKGREMPSSVMFSLLFAMSMKCIEFKE